MSIFSSRSIRHSSRPFIAPSPGDKASKEGAFFALSAQALPMDVALPCPHSARWGAGSVLLFQPGIWDGRQLTRATGGAVSQMFM